MGCEGDLLTFDLAATGRSHHSGCKSIGWMGGAQPPFDRLQNYWPFRLSLAQRQGPHGGGHCEGQGVQDFNSTEHGPYPVWPDYKIIDFPGNHLAAQIHWPLRSARTPKVQALFREMTPAIDPKQGKLDQPGKNPAPNTSKSAPVVKKSKSGICFYPVGVRIIGVSALGPNSAILIFHTPDDHQNHHCFSP